ncbi:MAG: N-acetylneuraminate synthase family protein [Pelagibacteraceae bacterium]|nr:N-acetylneuraminate synthase family protein [Pelagibacteraceae bacterium]MCI5078844.1 N-acetylneuraminate synthase family protein [Pelagibacteraceae bacterium]
MFKIKNRIINQSNPLFICEVGINHNGSFNEAKKLIDLAHKAGAECIKHQTHNVDHEMILEAKKTIPGNAKISIYDIIKKKSLPFSFEIKLKRYVEKKGMIYLSTPFSKEAAIHLNNIKVPAFKIGSGECNNYPLIEFICKFKKPIILSTGMNDLKSVSQAVKIIKKNKVPLALLQCTSIYPTPPEKVNLSILNLYKKKFKNIEVGYSDHTLGTASIYASISYGASIIEKHFTDTKKRKGPDIQCSIDYEELKNFQEYLKVIKLNKKLVAKKVLKEEIVTANFAYASVVTVSNIKKGERLSNKNIWVKRPGTGDFLAKSYKKLLGKKAKQNIKAGVFLNKEHV